MAKHRRNGQPGQTHCNEFSIAETIDKQGAYRKVRPLQQLLKQQLREGDVQGRPVGKALPQQPPRPAVLPLIPAAPNQVRVEPEASGARPVEEQRSALCFAKPSACLGLCSM